MFVSDIFTNPRFFWDTLLCVQVLLLLLLLCAGAVPGHPPPRRLQVQLEPEDTQVDHTALLTLQGDLFSFFLTATIY